MRERAEKVANHAKLMPLAAAMGLVGLLVGCDSKFYCDPVNTREKAFELSKQYILANKMKELVAVGGGASIFEGSLEEEPVSSCNRPQRFHFSRKTITDDYQVEWYMFVQRRTNECWKKQLVWETINVGTIVTRCGRVGINGKINRQANPGTEHCLYDQNCGPQNSAKDTAEPCTGYC